MPTTHADRLLERIDGLTAQRGDEPGVVVLVTRGAHVIARRSAEVASGARSSLRSRRITL